MTFDPKKEPLITFGELAKHLPRGGNGRPVSLSTLHRWRTRGVAGGIRLDAICVGGRWCTSWAAFSRFNAQVTAAKSAPSPLPTANGSDITPGYSLSASDLPWS